MELVLADDFSGAAEIAGLAFRSGRSVSLLSGVSPGTTEPDTEVVVVDTDSRLLTSDRAATRVSDLCRCLASWNPDQVYKKIDSVLRGSVVAEVEALMSALSFSDAVVASANPTRKRLIEDGHYFIDGVPLHETEFGHDPIHPAVSSRVLDLVGPSPRVFFPDVTDLDALRVLAEQRKKSTLPVGGSDFYCSLHRIEAEPVDTAPISAGRRLWVCGSRANQRQRSDLFLAKGVETFPYDSEVSAEDWSKRAERFPGDHDIALLLPEDAQPDPRLLEETLTGAAAHIIRTGKPEVVFAEGGATARALIDRLGATRFSVRGELATGVVVLNSVDRSDLPMLVVKPGSYPWPGTAFR